jgi:uncharacterized membrane protein YgaE (UPF0421/DUF939 family)
MNTELIKQIQKLFEFEVPREPVQSTMVQPILQKIQNIWQGNLRQYASTTEQQLRSKIKDFKQLTNNLNKVNSGMRRAVGTDPLANKKVSVPVDAIAHIDLMAHEMPDVAEGKKIIKIRKLYGALVQESFIINEKPTKNPEEKLNELTKVITARAREWGLTKEQIYGILALTYDGDLNIASWTAWLNNLSKAEQTADTNMKGKGI